MSPSTVQGRAYLMAPQETPTASWRDFVPEAWQKLMRPRVPVSLVGSLMMDRAMEIDHQALENAIRRYGTPTRHRLTAAHGPVIEAARQWPDLLARSFEHIWSFFSGGQTFADTTRKLSRTREAVSGMAEFMYAVENSLNRRLIQRWPASDYGETTIARTEIVKDFRAQKVVGMSSVADLPVVAESAPYVNATVVSTWVSSAPVTKHGYTDYISLEAVRTDDIRAIARRVDELTDAAHRTLARAVWTPWINNSPAHDAVAWHAAGHNNLQSTALSSAEVQAAVTKILNQTKPGTTEKLGLPVRPGVFHLVVPPALWSTAVGINQQVAVDATLHHFFGSGNEYIHANALLADSTDWGVYVDVRYIESVRVLCLDREEPLIELADDAAQGALFANDQIAYKVSHHFSVVAPTEYRGSVKAVVA